MNYCFSIFSIRYIIIYFISIFTNGLWVISFSIRTILCLSMTSQFCQHPFSTGCDRAVYHSSYAHPNQSRSLELEYKQKQFNSTHFGTWVQKNPIHFRLQNQWNSIHFESIWIVILLTNLNLSFALYISVCFSISILIIIFHRLLIEFPDVYS